MHKSTNKFINTNVCKKKKKQFGKKFIVQTKFTYRIIKAT